MPTATPQPSAPAPAATVPAKPRRKRRLLKVLLAAVIAVALVIALVQAVLWSDYPRQIGISVAQRVTGLRVEIDKLTITWAGRTTIDGLRVSLPLSDKPFLVAPTIRAKHTPLPLILFTLGVSVDGIAVDRPELDVVQNADRSWNLQQALAQLSTPGKNASSGGPATLPEVELNDVRVHVRTADGRALELSDIAFVGKREKPLVWTFAGHVADLATTDGEISASGRWPHQVSATLKPKLLTAIQPLVGDLPPGLSVASATVNWVGERTETGVIGRLTLPDKTTQAGPVTASGATRLTLDGTAVTAAPEGLLVTVPGLPTINLAGGSARYAAGMVDLNGVRVRFAGGSARISGSADLAKARGNVTASWEQVQFPGGVTHQGRVALEAANVWPGRPWVRGELYTLGTAAGGTFEANGTVAGDGTRWDDATFTFDVPLARYGKKSQLRIEDIQAVVHATGEAVELQSVRTRQSATGPATLDARGRYAFGGADAGLGYLVAVGNRFRFAGEDDLFFNLNAWVDPRSVTLQNAYASLGTEAWANLAGRYVFNEPEPVRMQLDFDTDPALSLNLSRTIGLAGHASGSMKVGGTLSGDPAVTVTGNLSSRRLKVNQFDIGDADLLVRGLLTKDKADFGTEHLTAFGGQGWFGGNFTYFENQVQASMGFSDISLAEIGQAVGSDRLSGTASGRFDVFVPTEDLRQVGGSGRIDVIKPAAKPLVEADSVSIPVQIGAGYVSVKPVAKQARGGVADVKALVSLNNPTRFRLNVDLANWLTQLPLAEFSVLTSGRVDLPQFDLASQSGNGNVTLGQRFFAHDKPIGDLHAAATATGRQIKLDGVSGNVLGGRVYGVGNVDFDNPAAGELWAGVEGLSLDRLAEIDQRLTGVQGALSARVHTHAAVGDRPLGPVQADIGMETDRATYKGIQIGDSRVRLFADTDRVALSDDPNDPNYINLAGGRVGLWGRLSQVPEDASGVSRTSAFASVKLDNIDTEQLNQMYDPDGHPVPGRLGGEVVVFGNPTNVKRLSGQGTLNLTKSDLGNIGPLAVLYNVMHAGFGPQEPNGEGSVGFRLNEGRLIVTGMNYFNRGVYARAALTIDDALNPKDSHLSGYLLGTYRPLKDLNLPFFGTLDGILDALQSSATTIRVDGTMQQPNAAPASLKDISGDLKSIIAGEAKSQ